MACEYRACVARARVCERVRESAKQGWHRDVYAKILQKYVARHSISTNIHTHAPPISLYTKLPWERLCFSLPLSSCFFLFRYLWCCRHRRRRHYSRFYFKLVAFVILHCKFIFHLLLIQFPVHCLISLPHNFLRTFFFLVALLRTVLMKTILQCLMHEWNIYSFIVQWRLNLGTIHAHITQYYTTWILVLPEILN